MHIDETSHYSKDKLGWCWVFANNEASLIKLADTRGVKFLESSTFSSYKNLVVTDRYAVYNYFSDEKKTDLLGTLVKGF